MKTTSNYCNGFGRVNGTLFYEQCKGCKVCRDRKRFDRQNQRKLATRKQRLSSV